MQQVPEIDRIQLATTEAETKAPLIEIARKHKLAVFQGSEEDVLKRFIQAGEAIEAQHIVRICGDDPIDPFYSGVYTNRGRVLRLDSLRRSILNKGHYPDSRPET